MNMDQSNHIQDIQASWKTGKIYHGCLEISGEALYIRQKVIYEVIFRQIDNRNKGKTMT